jgi:nicotinamidase-related amidase
MEQNSALMVMDMQGPILQRLGDPTTFLKNVANAISVARNKKIPVMYVIVGFRPGAPEISDANKSFAAMNDREKWTSEFISEWMKIHPDVAPQQNEVVVVKRRISAFTGSDLEVVLRSRGIQHLILSGIATSGVVLSTLREAADKDYRLTVLGDCCADADEEVHRVLTTKVFPRQAEVLTTDQWNK